MRITSLALPLALVACGDNTPAPDDDTTVPGRTITGSQVVHHRLYDRSTVGETPTDLWDTVIEAHVPAGNGWVVRPGTGHRDGTFEIEDVPDGHFWLRVARRPFGESFYWTDADHISFDEDSLGPEVPDSAGTGDRLQLDLDGLAAWEDGDELAWFVPEDFVFDVSLFDDRPPGTGTTELQTAVDWTGRPLARVPAGEPAYLVQYRTQRLAGVDVRAPVRAAQPTIEQVAGVDGTLDATLTAPAPTPYRLAWARDEFEAQRAAIHPTLAGPSFFHSFTLFALPDNIDGDLWGFFEYPVAMLADPSILEGTTPLDLGELPIASPFPREWLVDSYVTAFPVDFPLPDGTPQTLEAVIGQRSHELSTATGPARPLVTPLRAPKIGGRDAFRAQAGVGTTPTISWSPPATGTATSYRLQIIEGITDPPVPFRPGWYVSAELVVPGDVTSVRVPADVLRPGATYGIVVRTFAQPGHEVTTRPFQQRATAGFADAVLGPFTP